jgi:SAM-dependent methyltransferase
LDKLNDILSSLRKKWHEVPAGAERFSTKDIIAFDDDRLEQWWLDTREAARSGGAFPVRGWYHLLYSDVFRGKKILDVGSGLGLDGLTFAQQGAHVTFLDIVESNLFILRRLCTLLKLTNVEFRYLDTLGSLDVLANDYDVIWCQGSMINAPFDLMAIESRELLKHLPIGGRWIELAYPPKRWEREGMLPFNEWGKRTDGDGTPWVEWYDLEKLLARLAPATFDVVLHFNFHNDDFNWFDLIRRS